MNMMMKTFVTYISSLLEMNTRLIPLQMDGLVGRRIVHAINSNEELENL